MLKVTIQELSTSNKVDLYLPTYSFLGRIRLAWIVAKLLYTVRKHYSAYGVVIVKRVEDEYKLVLFLDNVPILTLEFDIPPSSSDSAKELEFSNQALNF